MCPVLLRRGASRRALTLRGRAIVVFTAGAVVLLAFAAAAIWTVSSSYLLDLREQGGLRQAEVSARVVELLLVREDPQLQREAKKIADVTESGVLIVRDGETLVTTGLTRDEVPEKLQELVESGERAKQRVEIDGEVKLVVGIPLDAADAKYYQALPLSRLVGAMDKFRRTLLVVGLAGVVAAAVLGFTTARQALRPIDELTSAAEAVARGELDTRLPEDDPQLAQLASVFNASTAALERRVRSDARFASNVSHELRTPLTTMANALAVLERRRADLPDAAREAVELLSSQITRFERFVVDLLEISVVAEGSQDLALQPVDVSELVCRFATAEGIERAEASDGRVVVEADPRRLERIISNLVRNAKTHGKGLVRLAVCRQGDVARVEVDDAGPGVPPEARERIFERFDRGTCEDRAGQVSGAGIGLALVAELAALQNGRAFVEDRPGGGARFVLELPLLIPEQS